MQLKSSGIHLQRPGTQHKNSERQFTISEIQLESAEQRIQSSKIPLKSSAGQRHTSAIQGKRSYVPIKISGTTLVQLAELSRRSVCVECVRRLCARVVNSVKTTGKLAT